MTYLYNKHSKPCFRLDPDRLSGSLRFQNFCANACTPFWKDNDDIALLEASRRHLVRFSKNRRYVCDVDVSQWRPRTARFLPRRQAMILEKRILS